MSWSRNPSGSNQGSASRSQSCSSAQPPCSGWSANARLFTYSHACSSVPTTNGRVAIEPGPRRGLGLERERTAQLVQLALLGEAQIRGDRTVGGRRVARPPVHRPASLLAHHLDGRADDRAEDPLSLGPMVRIDLHLDAPCRVASSHLGRRDRRLVRQISSNDRRAVVVPREEVDADRGHTRRLRRGRDG